MAICTTLLSHVTRTIITIKFAIFYTDAAQMFFFIPSVQIMVSLDKESHGYSFDDTQNQKLPIQRRQGNLHVIKEGTQINNQ
jgi:hypothetical protein